MTHLGGGHRILATVAGQTPVELLADAKFFQPRKQAMKFELLQVGMAANVPEEGDFADLWKGGKVVGVVDGLDRGDLLLRPKDDQPKTG